MRLQTHGRWPLVGAAALAPVTAVAADRAALRPLAALLWHQTEEWVWPGGFLPWINREVLGGEADEFPLDRRIGVIVNVGFGWGLSLATLGGPSAAAGSTLLYVSHLGNAVLHAAWALRHRRYDPGLVTAVGTLVPVAVHGLRELHRDERVSRGAMRAGAVAGAIFAFGLMGSLRLRQLRRG